jgi:uncharacterized circularly permuted ATP-grasp superfamily protein
VLWRRLDAAFADPLELDELAYGTPGLARSGPVQGVTMVNALGAGVLESRAMLAFLPQAFRGPARQAACHPNIATWWCGGEAERDHVRANAAKC